MHLVGCVRHSTEGGKLRVEISVRCLVDQIAAQAKIPIRESRHEIKGDVLVIEITPDVESILNTVLSK